MTSLVRIQFEPLDLNRETETLRNASPGIGAVVTFVGQMRDFNQGDPVKAMLLEHYPGMTERVLQQIVAEARERWGLIGVRVIHRVGELSPLDPIVLIAVASAHRAEAFKACEFIIDALKSRAPFWKKETMPQGERWLSPDRSDDKAYQTVK